MSQAARIVTAPSLGDRHSHGREGIGSSEIPASMTRERRPDR
jgi:hypothetical protein